MGANLVWAPPPPPPALFGRKYKNSKDYHFTVENTELITQGNSLFYFKNYVPSHFQIRSYGPEFSLDLLAISLLPYGLCFFHCRLKVSIVKSETGKFRHVFIVYGAQSPVTS